MVVGPVPAAEPSPSVAACRRLIIAKMLADPNRHKPEYQPVVERIGRLASPILDRFLEFCLDSSLIHLLSGLELCRIWAGKNYRACGDMPLGHAPEREAVTIPR